MVLKAWMFHFSSSIVEIAKKGRFPRHGLRAAFDSARDGTVLQATKRTTMVLVEETTKVRRWFSMDNKIQTRKNSK